MTVMVALPASASAGATYSQVVVSPAMGTVARVVSSPSVTATCSAPSVIGPASQRTAISNSALPPGRTIA